MRDPAELRTLDMNVALQSARRIGRPYTPLDAEEVEGWQHLEHLPLPCLTVLDKEGWKLLRAVSIAITDDGDGELTLDEFKDYVAALLTGAERVGVACIYCDEDEALVYVYYLN